MPPMSISPLIEMNNANPLGENAISVFEFIPSELVLATVKPIVLLASVGPCSTVVMKFMIACSRANSVKHASALVAFSSKLNAVSSLQPGISIISLISSSTLSVQPARVMKRAITIANFLFMHRHGNRYFIKSSLGENR